MKFTVERSLLLDAVSRLQKIVGSKTSPQPILDGILISAEPGMLSLCAYNNESGMKKEIYCSCERAGDIVINARILSDILRKMNGLQLEIEAEDNLLCHIRCSGAEFDIMGMKAIDFPELPSIADGTKISLPGDILCDMIKGTIFAAAQLEGTRPILTGINFKIYDGILQLVAVDGFRLAVRRQKINLQGDHEFTVSNRALSEVIKLIDEQTEDVDIVIGKRLISFNVNGYVFISSLLEGEYVNFEKLIPEQYKQRAFMNSSDFINTIERVSLLISDSFTTPIRCIFNEDKVSMATKTAIGHAKEKFPLVLEGEEFEIGLNSKITLEALKACDQGNIQLRFNGVNSGIVIVSADENNKDFLYLIMPMRLKEWSN